MRTDTVFDLASLTKVTVTLPCVLALVARGEVDLDAPVQRYLPRFREQSVTVRHLLTHTSGLPESPPLYRSVSGRQEMADALYDVRIVAPAGSRVMYSDIGFAILGLLVESATGAALEEIAQEWVFRPLGMSARFVPPPQWRARCAATEVVHGEAVVGRVHDENAAAAGGVSGHAGLFATVQDMQVYAQSWTDTSATILPLEIRRDATRCHTGAAIGGRRGLGWVCRGDGADFF
jgi:CubicO group peptidase (beta-lactamase class C family)